MQVQSAAPPPHRPGLLVASGVDRMMAAWVTHALQKAAASVAVVLGTVCSDRADFSSSSYSCVEEREVIVLVGSWNCSAADQLPFPMVEEVARNVVGHARLVLQKVLVLGSARLQGMHGRRTQAHEMGQHAVCRSVAIDVGSTMGLVS